MIKIYTLPNCKNCEEVKEYLVKNNIEFENINLKIKENRDARTFYRSLGIKSAPVIVGRDKNNEEWILAEFNEKEFIELLES